MACRPSACMLTGRSRGYRGSCRSAAFGTGSDPHLEIGGLVTVASRLEWRRHLHHRSSRAMYRITCPSCAADGEPLPAWPLAGVTFGGKWQEIFAAIWRGPRAGWTCACRRACRPGQASCSDRPSLVLGFWVLSRLRVSDTGEGHRHRPGDAASLRTAQLRVNSRARR
jgi:hypothetical protein